MRIGVEEKQGKSERTKRPNNAHRRGSTSWYAEKLSTLCPWDAFSFGSTPTEEAY